MWKRQMLSLRTGLKINKGLCIPPFTLVGRCLSQVREQDTQHLSCSPSMGGTALVPSTVTSECRFSTPITNGPVASQQGGVTSPSSPK